MKLSRVRRWILGCGAAVFSTAALSGAGEAAQCAAPNTPARASLDLRLGEVHFVHDRDTPGMRSIVNQLQGYVAGPWHLPLGLTVADLAMRFETKFYYDEAQTVGHCAALAEARVIVGYPEITVYISSDYPEGSCEYDTILAHEQEHVAINRAALQAYQGEFEAALRRMLRAKKAIYTLRKEEARSAYVLELRRQLEPVAADMVAERNRKNGAIDTQDNYRRILSQCSNWRGSDLQAAGSGARSGAAGGTASGEAQPATAPQSASAGAPAAATRSHGSAGNEIAAATSGPSGESRTADPGPVDFVQQGRELTKANARQLETALKTLPYDFPTRARLLGFYYHNGFDSLGPAATIKARRRHILWLIENHPDSEVAGLPEAIIEPDGPRLADEQGYRQAKELWLQQAEQNQDNPAVRRNAARFLQPDDKAEAEDLL
jgi:hypothetical protein